MPVSTKNYDKSIDYVLTCEDDAISPRFIDAPPVDTAAELPPRTIIPDAVIDNPPSTLRAAGMRLTWLLPCMFGMLLTATVLNLSRPRFDLALFAALALFVPMIGAMGGNTGIQISTIIIHGFAVGERSTAKLLRALIREGRIALTMAPVCGLAAWLLATAFFPIFQSMTAAYHLEPTLADVAHAEARAHLVPLAVGCAMTLAILSSALLGILMPFVFRRVGVDPAIASGPLVATMNDVTSVSIYMIVALTITAM